MLGRAWTAVMITLAAAGVTATASAAGEEISFCIFGDYGVNNGSEGDVAAMVRDVLQPQFIMTVGDNNYGDLTQVGYDVNVGQYYCSFIGNYTGNCGTGPKVNQFFPSLGNHDWGEVVGYQAYLDFFNLPGVERHYDFVRGPVHIFVLNTDEHEPDGHMVDSAQAMWLRDGLAASTSPWKFVVGHHPGFSSGSSHGSDPFHQWPFKEWGAHAVFNGHDHTYERMDIAGLPCFIIGIGGAQIGQYGELIPQSELHYNMNYAAMKVVVDEKQARFELWSLDDGGTLMDSLIVPAGPLVNDLTTYGATWRFLDDGSDQGAAWRQLGFDDSAWSAGPAHLGYGDDDELTIVDFGPDPDAKYITTYFRHEFQVPDTGVVGGLSLQLLCDDGAAVYLNGVEVLRRNLPGGVIAFDTLADVSVGDAQEDFFYPSVISPCQLRQGANVIAVEVHQENPSSSDISFDLMLTPIAGNPSCCADIAPPGPPIGNGQVNIDDLLMVINQWAGRGGSLADINHSGVVNVDDLLAVINGWGPCR